MFVCTMRVCFFVIIFFCYVAAQQGPKITTTTRKAPEPAEKEPLGERIKEKVESKLKSKAKQYLFMKGQRRVKVTLQAEPSQYLLLQGLKLHLECPEVNDSSVVEWFFGGTLLEPEKTKRLSEVEHDKLKIYPLIEMDSGRFECYVDDEFRGEVSLQVLTLTAAFGIGFRNFCASLFVSVPAVALLFGYQHWRKYKGKRENEDPMLGFYQKEMEIHDDEKKERVVELSKMGGPIEEPKIKGQQSVVQTMLFMDLHEKKLNTVMEGPKKKHVLKFAKKRKGKQTTSTGS